MPTLCLFQIVQGVVFFRYNMISAQHQWHRVCSLWSMTGVCAVCRCWFYTTIRFRRKFLPYCFYRDLSEQVNFRALDMIFLSFLFIFVVRVLNWCSAGYSSYLLLFLHFYTSNKSGQWLISGLQPFLGKVLSEPEACIEQTIGSILF